MFEFYPEGYREHYQLKLEEIVKCPTLTNRGLLFLPNGKSKGSMAIGISSTIYLYQKACPSLLGSLHSIRSLWRVHVSFQQREKKEEEK